MHRQDAQALTESQRLERSVAIVDGRRLAYVKRGEGAPPVVFLSGAGMSLDSWFKVFPAIAGSTSALMYDRPGVGGSERPAIPQTGDVIVRSLRDLLTRSGTVPPHVLVGHSLGGLFVELFARRHPDEVAAVVLIDAATVEEARHPPPRGPAMRFIDGISGLVDRVRGRHGLSEIDRVAATAAQVVAAGPFPAIPLVVIAGGHRMRMIPQAAFDAHLDAQRRRVSISPLGSLVVAERSGHFPHLTEPDVVIDAILSVVGSSRSVTRTT